ncbi:MAG: CGP-CTERM sorting domain-containing protein [Thermococci archaeon]|nr:CGP-CTERM sorting domain-containing protein [Thermococci archaeon]
MKKSAVWLLIAFVLAAFVLPGAAGATGGMYETQVKEYTVHDDGSANVTFNITFYGPPSYLNTTRAEIRKVGLDNYTRLYVKQMKQKLEGAGYNVSNVSARIICYNSTNGAAPIRVIVRADLTNFAHYFKWGNVWEIRPDPLMIRDMLRMNISRLNMSMTVNNTFIYHLPHWAKIIETPGRYVMQANGSVINMTTEVRNETVYVHSYIHFKKGITPKEFEYLYSKPRLFLIEYTGKAGPENYVTWGLATYENFTVRKDGSILISILEVYTGKWADYVRYKLAMTLSLYGVNSTERMLAYYKAKQLEQQGLQVTNFKATMSGLRGNGPVKIKYELLTAPSSKTKYVIQYRPKLGFANFTFPDKSIIAINTSTVLQIKLPKGWKFIKVPKSVSASANGTILKLDVSREGNLLKIDNLFYMRYGTPNQTLAEIMSKIPTAINISYEGKPTTMTHSSGNPFTSPSSSNTGSSTASSSSGRKICGPAAIAGLALLPLLLRRRR